MARKLVAYFSAGKETRFTARDLARIMDADLYEIVPLEPYTEEDLDYTNPASRTCQEKNDPDFRPALAESDFDLSPYELIFLGFPVWWDSIPAAVAAYLEQNDFKGKIIVPFGTSKGGGMGSSAADIREIVGEETKVTDGMLLNGTFGKFQLETWLLTMGVKL